MNKDIDNIFSDKTQDSLKKAIKKDRKKLNIKIISITIVITLFIMILGNLGLSFLSNKYVANQFNKELDIITMEYQVKHPNEYISHQSYLETGYFKFQSSYDISRKLNSKVIYSNNVKALGGLSKNNAKGDSRYISQPFPALDKNLNDRSVNSHGLRNLNFMYPYVDYENTTNDFEILNEIDDSKTLEMALSFDKEYTYDQVNELLDSNLITFYWVNDSNEDNKQFEIENKSYENGDSAIGIKSTFYDGTNLTDTSDRLSKFKYCIQYFKENLNPNVNSDIDLDNIKISGVVVTGNPSSLKNLQNNKFIKHAIIGTVVDKY